jgi:hypothetical protein
MKMTKEEAQEWARKSIESAKKFGLPMSEKKSKPKKKKA